MFFLKAYLVSILPLVMVTLFLSQVRANNLQKYYIIISLFIALIWYCIILFYAEDC